MNFSDYKGKSESVLIEKYRLLDDRGKYAVDTMLNFQYEIAMHSHFDAELYQYYSKQITTTDAGRL